MSYPAYPEYKDSGFDWLGEVPAHWGLKKIAWHVPYSVGWTPSSGKEEYYDGDNLWVTIADLNKPVIFDTKSKISNKALDDRGGRLSPAGSMLFSFKLTVGNVSFLGKPAYTNEAIASFEPNDSVDLRYWSYAAPEFIPKYGRQNIYGALLLNQELIGAVRFYAPSIQEQAQLATFLDHETARIDALVEEQQRLIALLKEKRQAVISQAVTKGLDPDVPMKDSGVEWLGEVPEHWGVRGLTKLIGPVVDYRGRTPTKADDGVFLVTARNIRNGRIDYEISKEYVTPESVKSLLKRGKPEIGDLLFTMEAPLGQVALIDRTDIALAQRIVKFRGVEGVMINSYLMYWLMSTGCQARMETLATGSTALGIKASKLGMIECPAPPVAEQEEIVSRIERESVKHDVLLAEAQANIDLLQERRSALISAAVTGKIDVRSWKPPTDSVVSTEAKSMEAV